MHEASLSLTANQQIPFESLIADYGGMIARIAETYEAVPARREELVQEISLNLWRALPGFRGDAALKTFIARVAHNCSISHVAKETRNPRGDSMPELHIEEQSTPEMQTSLADRRSKLMQAIRQLPLHQRQLLSLMLEDLSHAEIADIMGLNTNTVAIRLSRARSRLKETMLKMETDSGQVSGGQL